MPRKKSVTFKECKANKQELQQALIIDRHVRKVRAKHMPKH